MRFQTTTIETFTRWAPKATRWAILLILAASVGCGGKKSDGGDGGADAVVDCTPGEFLGCDGNDAILCDTDGSSTVRNECGSAGCNADTGQCNQCDPTSAESCQGYQVVSCDENGNIIESEYCTWGCSETLGTPTCNECVAGEVGCQGDDLVTCGTGGAIESTVPCEFGCNVERAECNDCDPLMIECAGDSLVACDVDGTIEVSEVCTHGCSQEHLRCLCEAEKSTCDVNTSILEHCDATGLPSGAELCTLGCSTDGTDAWCNDCVPSTEMCAGNDLQPCDADGHLLPLIECPLGCDGTTNRCYTFTPTQLDENDLQMGTSDLEVINRIVVIDTENMWIDGVSAPPEVDGGTVTQVDPQTSLPAPNAPEIWVLYYRDVEVGLGSIEVVGTKALAIVASNTIDIAWGTLKAGGEGLHPGPGGRERYSAPWIGVPSPDGEHSEDDGTCNGHHTGAGGGGHAEAGGQGGAYDYDSTNGYYGEGGAGGSMLNDESMQILYGGGRGGGSVNGFYSGAGGGAVLLAAWTSVNIGGGSRVDVSGGGGFIDGAGGGAGGSLLIEAPTVTVYGTISAIGGGGACGFPYFGGGGEDGADGGSAEYCINTYGRGRGGEGGLSDDMMTGWACCGPDGLYPAGTYYGGRGNAGRCVESASGYDAVSGGGGGGAAGRMRIRSSFWPNSLTIDPGATLRVAPCNGLPELCIDYLYVH